MQMREGAADCSECFEWKDADVMLFPTHAMPSKRCRATQIVAATWIQQLLCHFSWPKHSWDMRVG